MSRIIKLLAKFAGVCAILVSTTVAFASVSVKNGNFYTGFTDITYAGGMEPEIQRVYNSKSNFKGLFGWGWGTAYETYLKISADGSVVLFEYGGGGENRFAPKALSEQELDQAVSMLAAAAKDYSNLANEQEFAAYKQKLKDDFEFRNKEWQTFLALGKVKARVLPEGTRLYSNRYEYETLTRTASGYLRVNTGGRTQSFDNNGRLLRISDKNSNFISFTYDQAGHLALLADNSGRKIKFTVNAGGLLESLEGENGARAEYKYNDLDELIYAKDVEGHTYTYGYDVNKRHNLTLIGYLDESTMTMAYYGYEDDENIKSVKERDGTVTEYSYRKDPADPGHYGRTIETKSEEGKLISTRDYEYFHKRKAGGEEWLQRMIAKDEGVTTDTTYNECCGLPLSIKRNGEEVTFEYDAKGHVTKKETADAIRRLEYDPQLGKVTRVSTRMKDDSGEEWSQFAYDARGNLTGAKNSAGNELLLTYDRHGLISSISDKKDKRTLTFKYNKNAKPVEIKVAGVGAIKVRYDADDNILTTRVYDVHDKPITRNGGKIALIVTERFKNLLEIVKPAGVNLGF